MRRCGSYPVLHSASANEAGLGTRGKKTKIVFLKAEDGREEERDILIAALRARGYDCDYDSIYSTS